MSFYWIYDLPNWLLCVLIVAITVGPGACSGS